MTDEELSEKGCLATTKMQEAFREVLITIPTTEDKIRFIYGVATVCVGGLNDEAAHYQNLSPFDSIYSLMTWISEKLGIIAMVVTQAPSPDETKH